MPQPTFPPPTPHPNPPTTSPPKTCQSPLRKILQPTPRQYTCNSFIPRAIKKSHPTQNFPKKFADDLSPSAHNGSRWRTGQCPTHSNSRQRRHRNCTPPAPAPHSVQTQPPFAAFFSPSQPSSTPSATAKKHEIFAFFPLFQPSKERKPLNQSRLQNQPMYQIVNITPRFCPVLPRFCSLFAQKRLVFENRRHSKIARRPPLATVRLCPTPPPGSAHATPLQACRRIAPICWFLPQLSSPGIAHRHTPSLAARCLHGETQ